MSRWELLCLGGALGWIVAAMPCTASAQFRYSPDHPEVQAIVRRAADYLRTTLPSDMGHKVLRSLAIAEASLRIDKMIPEGDPLIDSGVEAAMAYTRGADGRAVDGETMYATGVCVVLLSLYGDAYRENLQSALQLLEERQQAGGGWGYKADGTASDYGDTSQMQYCCLAMWVSKRLGLEVKPTMAKNALEWLIETQAGDGGWRYRATRGDPRSRASGGAGVTLSLTAAGAGSVYMLSDILGATPPAKIKRRSRTPGFDLPLVVQEFIPTVDEDPSTQPAEGSSQYVSVDTVRGTMGRANGWLRQNFRPDPEAWRYYFLYGFERYAYFREAIEGEVSELPDWYDRGVDFLRGIQQQDGSFRNEGGGGESQPPLVSTAFAVLFLVRSTELLANETVTGQVLGSQGFQSGKLALRRGQIVNEQIQQNVEDFMQAIESGKELDLAQFSGSLSNLIVPTDPAQRAQYLQRLRVLVNDEDFDKRYVAVRYLGSVRELDNVPALIYAMTDPAPDIVVAAHNGLRFISRKIDSIQLPAGANRENCKGIKEQWEKWYLSVRPGADLMYETER